MPLSCRSTRIRRDDRNGLIAAFGETVPATTPMPGWQENSDPSAGRGHRALFAAALHRGWNVHALPVLGDRAAGNIDAVSFAACRRWRRRTARRPAAPRRSSGGCGRAPPRTNARRRRPTRAIEAVKKYRSSNTPRGVSMYLLAVTRLTVDSCMPMASATVRRLSGRRCRTPWMRKASCWRTISDATLRMVFARWSRLLVSQLALCRQSARNPFPPVLRCGETWAK